MLNSKRLLQLVATGILIASLGHTLYGCAQHAGGEKGVQYFHFAVNQSPIRIPFENSADPRIFLQARINNSEPLYFLLDTGATWSFLDPSKAEALSLKTEGQRTILGGGATPVGITFAHGLSLDISGAKLSNQTFAIAPIKIKSTRPVAGIIGSPFFKQYIVAIDYRARSLSLFDPQRYQYSGSGDVIPFELQEEIPAVRVRLAIGTRSPVEAKLMVDTGAAWPLQLNRPFVESHKLLDSTEGMLKLGSPAGLGGGTSFLAGRAKFIKLGRFTLENQIVSFSQDQKGFGARSDWDGWIGTATLNRFKVILDYPHQRMILEPNELFGVTFDYDLTGLTVVAEGKAFKISSVFNGSRASAAGLQAGDVMMAVDGRPVSEMTIIQLCRMLKQNGSEHVLSIKRGEEMSQVKIQMMNIK